jgi:glycosyltransferase involved in cell wall biosynthesis
MNLELPPAPLEVITLHDIVAWKYADESPPVAAAAEEARRAAAVVCVSRFTAMEAVDLLGIESPHVVPNGVEARWFDAEPLSQAVLDSMGIDGPYVLAAGGASQRKNLAALAEAWPTIRAARPALRLVLAGPPHARRDALFAHLPGVRLVGLLPAERVPGLYAAASVLVVPSLDEGFGLPALEAMAVGTPVVAANRAALPEVVGDDGILVEPTSGGLSRGILDALDGGTDLDRMVERARGRAATYTWEASAMGHARVWREVAGAAV